MAEEKAVKRVGQGKKGAKRDGRGIEKDERNRRRRRRTRGRREDPLWRPCCIALTSRPSDLDPISHRGALLLPHSKPSPRSKRDPATNDSLDFASDRDPSVYLV